MNARLLIFSVVAGSTWFFLIFLTKYFFRKFHTALFHEFSIKLISKNVILPWWKALWTILKPFHKAENHNANMKIKFTGGRLFSLPHSFFFSIQFFLCWFEVWTSNWTWKRNMSASKKWTMASYQEIVMPLSFFWFVISNLLSYKNWKQS